MLISCAMSVSWIAELDDCRLVWVTDRLLMVCCRRFCRAPKLARAVETDWMAASMDEMADSASVELSTLRLLSTPRVLEVKSALKSAV